MEVGGGEAARPRSRPESLIDGKARALWTNSDVGLLQEVTRTEKEGKERLGENMGHSI